MDKKTLPLVVVLLVGIIFYWPIMEFLGFATPESERPLIVTDSITDSSVTINQVDPAFLPQTDVMIAQAPVPPEFVNDSLPVDSIWIETKKYSIVLSSLGGGPVSIKLKDYLYRDDGYIEMLPNSIAATPNLIFKDGATQTSNLRFISNLQTGRYEASSSNVNLTYTYTTEAGGQIVRSFTFYPDSYHIDMSVRVVNAQTFGFERSYNVEWNTPLGLTEPDAGPDYMDMRAVAMQGGSSVILDDYEGMTLKQEEVGAAEWVGVRSRYFAAFIVPKTRSGESVYANGQEKEIVIDGSSVDSRKITAGIKMYLDAGVDFEHKYQIVVGPLDYSMLSDYEVGLEDMLDIGTTPVVGILIKPFAIFIIWLLPILYSFIGNYGFVIIAFAILVKIVTLPLSLKAFKSMRAMKDIQPHMDKLKEKHKKDPQQLNQEMMKLYKKHGVSPLSGCLPMLPQMPLLFALFAVFRSTILLRDAPFIWFIDDLSKGATGLTDPYIILVLLMVATQFVSQTLTMPSTGQNKGLMYAMPLFMGFIFYSYSAGLVLYWTCFSLLSLVDYFLFRRNKNAEVKAA